MSSGRDIVKRISVLVQDVDELLQTSTAKTAKSIALQLDCRDQLDGAVEKITINLSEFEKWISTIQEPLQQIQALKGIIILLNPIVIGFKQIIGSADKLAEAEMSDVFKGIEQVENTVAGGEKVLRKGRNLLDTVPTVEDVRDAQEKLSNLIDTIKTYAQEEEENEEKENGNKRVEEDSWKLANE